jgi:hypothetical protein
MRGTVRGLIHLGLPILAALAGCATHPPVNRGGQVYAVRVASVNGRPTSNRGSVAFPACTLQFGDRVVQVWLAHPSRLNAVSPVIVEADEVALKEGVLLERSWQEAVVHEVTDAELASGTAVVYIPSVFNLTVVELSFEPIGVARRSGPQNDLPKDSPGLDELVPRRNVSKR